MLLQVQERSLKPIIMTHLLNVILVSFIFIFNNQNSPKSHAIVAVDLVLGRGYSCQQKGGACSIKESENFNFNGPVLIYHIDSLDPIELIIPFKKDNFSYEKHLDRKLLIIDYDLNLKVDKNEIIIKKGPYYILKKKDTYSITF